MDADPQELLETAKRAYLDDRFSDCISLCLRVEKIASRASACRTTALHLLGEAQMDLDQFDAAEATYSKLLQVDKTDIAYANRGFCRMEQKKWALASSDYHEAIGINPTNLIAVKFAGECMMHLKNFIGAISLLEEYSIKESDAGIHHVLGLCYCHMGRYSDGYREFAKAVKIDPEYDASAEMMLKIREMISDK